MTMYARTVLVRCNETAHFQKRQCAVRVVVSVEQAAGNKRFFEKALMQAIHEAACGGSAGPSPSLAAVTVHSFTLSNTHSFFLYVHLHFIIFHCVLFPLPIPPFIYVFLNMVCSVQIQQADSR